MSSGFCLSYTNFNLVPHGEHLDCKHKKTFLCGCWVTSKWKSKGKASGWIMCLSNQLQDMFPLMYRWSRRANRVVVLTPCCLWSITVCETLSSSRLNCFNGKYLSRAAQMSSLISFLWFMVFSCTSMIESEGVYLVALTRIQKTITVWKRGSPLRDLGVYFFHLKRKIHHHPLLSSHDTRLYF